MSEAYKSDPRFADKPNLSSFRLWIMLGLAFTRDVPDDPALHGHARGRRPGRLRLGSDRPRRQAGEALGL